MWGTVDLVCRSLQPADQKMPFWAILRNRQGAMVEKRPRIFQLAPLTGLAPSRSTNCRSDSGSGEDEGGRPRQGSRRGMGGTHGNMATVCRRDVRLPCGPRTVFAFSDHSVPPAAKHVRCRRQPR